MTNLTAHSRNAHGTDSWRRPSVDYTGCARVSRRILFCNFKFFGGGPLPTRRLFCFAFFIFSRCAGLIRRGSTTRARGVVWPGKYFGEHVCPNCSILRVFTHSSIELG